MPAAAISALRADAKAKALPSDALPTIDTSPKDTAERRQVTVMFADLVGSTLEHVPPELNSVGFPGRSGWQILSALIRFWERERCRRPTLLIFEVE